MFSLRLSSSFDQLACLGESRSLSELTLDGNPVALETWYKQAVLRCVLHLRQLDMKRITVSLNSVCVFTRAKEKKLWLSDFGNLLSFYILLLSHCALSAANHRITVCGYDGGTVYIMLCCQCQTLDRLDR